MSERNIRLREKEICEKLGISQKKDASKSVFVSDKERNIIYYGAPGTGKSFTLEAEREKLFKDHNGYFERVTFHRYYSYANFVGSYKPIMEKDNTGVEKITYRFVPGPFIRAYIEAILHKSEPSLLIIEEINRAEVASVFGEVFQLLDRNGDNESEYSVNPSEDLCNYLEEKLGNEIDCSNIKIPSNMFIWATMNSADQGVFPMDTAFKRRWDFKYIEINEGENEIKEKYVNLIYNGKKQLIEWNSLRKAINELLSNLSINEDKLLGPFFLSKKRIIDKTANDGTYDVIDEKLFKEAFETKVLMYLFEDAAKQKRSEIFKGLNGTLTFSKVLDGFRKNGIDIFDFTRLRDAKIKVAGD